MASNEPQVLLEGLSLPEGPRWHDGRLWFSDIKNFRVMTVDENGKAEEVATGVQGEPSGLGFLPDGRLLIATMRDRKLLRREPDGGISTVVDLSGIMQGDNNDMVVDRQGRAYIGGFGYEFFNRGEPRPGSVAMVRPDGSARIVAADMVSPNGMVISEDGRTLIVAEPGARRLTAFRIEDDGSLADRRVYAQTESVTPDGIALDAEDCVWCGSPMAHEFVRVREGGEIADRISLPGKLTLACAFGGQDRRTLFLCTVEGTMEQLVAGTGNGRIEAVRVDVPGAGIP